MLSKINGLTVTKGVDSVSDEIHIIKRALKRFYAVIDSLECECDGEFVCSIHDDIVLARMGIRAVERLEGGLFEILDMTVEPEISDVDNVTKTVGVNPPQQTHYFGRLFQTGDEVKLKVPGSILYEGVAQVQRIDGNKILIAFENSDRLWVTANYIYLCEDE